MPITATLIEILPIQTGHGKNGAWKKQDIIVESQGQYAKKVCVDLRGNQVTPKQVLHDNNPMIDFDIGSKAQYRKGLRYFG